MNNEQEGAEEDVDNTNDDDIPVEDIETDDKEEQAAGERRRKTSQFMTKYERARILGTRAVQIRYFKIKKNLTIGLNLFISVKILITHL